MDFNPWRMALYLISDRKLRPDFVDVFIAIAKAAPRGQVMFQVREKDLSSGELYALTRALVSQIKPLDAMVLVNDRADVALAANADGVHLSTRSVLAGDAKKLGLVVGASTHSKEEIEQAHGADFCTFGPIYDTPSKRALGKPLGLDALAAHTHKTMPLYALGGVKEENIPALMQAGATGIAVIGAVLSAKEPVTQALAMLDAILRHS
jgi:thiamine-phosphate pyrophosphorylase